MPLPEYCQTGSQKSSGATSVGTSVSTQPSTTQAPTQATVTTQSSPQTVQNTSDSSASASTSTSNSTTTTTNPNRKTMPAYAVSSMDISDYFNIEDIGKSISNNVGEVMTKLGYAGYNPELEETPVQRVYDNTVDYRVLNQGLSNLKLMK